MKNFKQNLFMSLIFQRGLLDMNIFNLIYNLVLIGLVILFFVSFAKFVYTIVSSLKQMVVMTRQINQKLDQILCHLEKKNDEPKEQPEENRPWTVCLRAVSVLMIAIPDFPSLIRFGHENLSLRQAGAGEELREEQFHQQGFSGNFFSALLFGDAGVGGRFGSLEGKDSFDLIILVTGIVAIGFLNQLRKDIADFFFRVFIRLDQILRFRALFRGCRLIFRC